MRSLWFVALVALGGCMAGDGGSFRPAPTCIGTCPVSGPSPVTPPDSGAYAAASAGATGVDATDEDPLSIDLAACAHERLHMWLPLGSAWFLVHPQSASFCEIWIGGETEDPRYDGAPAQYCVFDRLGTLAVEQRYGGPILMQDMPWCVLL
jgi:hypothetical protein